MLSIKAPSQLYKEVHATPYAMLRLKGDQVLNQALDSRLEREATWTRKSSTVCNTDKMFQENIAQNNIVRPTTENKAEKNILLTTAKKAMTNSVKEETNTNKQTLWNNKVKKLTLKDDFINLLIEEQSNVTWKSIVNNIPNGVLSFTLKASVNGLNTPDNLKRWGAKKLDKCTICGNFGNLEHVLNWCGTALNQGRLKWRHNSVLSHMHNEITKVKPDDLTIFTDITGKDFNGGTIPADIITTGQRPDIVLISRKEKKIALLELTVSFKKCRKCTCKKGIKIL